MNFSRSDIMIIVSMGLAIILMTFVFSALGLAGEDVSESEIPEYNTTADNFDMAGDFPDSPGTPSLTYLEWHEELAGNSENSLWLHGDTSDGVQITTYNSNTTTNPNITFNYANWTNGNSDVTTVYLNGTEEGDIEVISQNQYKLFIEVTSVKNLNKSTYQYELRVEIQEQPEISGGFLGRIPLIGGIYDSAEALASIVGYIGILIWWFSATLVEVIVNLVLSLYGVIAFMVSFMHFLLSTYTSIVTGVSAWASVILALPGTLMMFEFTKLMIIGIKLLPTT